MSSIREDALSRLIESSRRLAGQRSHRKVETEHMLYSLLEDKTVWDLFALAKLDRTKVFAMCRDSLNLIDEIDKNTGYRQREESEEFKNICARAKLEAGNESRVEPVHILLAILLQKGCSAEMLLRECDVDHWKLRSILSNNDFNDPQFQQIAKTDAVQTAPAVPFPNQQSKQTTAQQKWDDLSKNKKSLKSFCTNLTEEAAINPPRLVGRECEIEQVARILSRKRAGNPVLVGDPGIGKTSIVVGLAAKIAKGDVPNALQGAVIYSLDIGKLVGGTRFRGDLEERMTSLIQELSMQPKAFLFIDEIHSIVTGGKAVDSMDVSDLLKPCLSSGAFRCIGATTWEEWRSHIEKNAALARRFVKVDVEEPNEDLACSILSDFLPALANHHGVTFAPGAIETAVKLSSRYIPQRRLPDKAIELLDEAASSPNKSGEVGLHEIELALRKLVRIPVGAVLGNESDALVRLPEKLKEKIFGQDQAIDTLVSAVWAARSGLNDPHKPSGCFLFVGPTGVGKTEICKQIADDLAMKLIKLDMSEYSEKHTISRLIGSPAGYVGYDEGGVLTEAVYRSPYSVILCDEIEKAHPEIFNLLLQVMDDGCLTDATGRKIDFRNTLVVMTSNVGADEMERHGLGFGAQGWNGDILDGVKRTFSPEFRNRLNAIVTFRHLDYDNLTKVAKSCISAAVNQANAVGIKLEFSDEAVMWVCRNGYDKQFGARPMKRLIQTAIMEPLAKLLITREVKPNDCVLVAQSVAADDSKHLQLIRQER